MSTAAQQPRLLRLDEAAERVGVSVPTLRRRIRSGDLPAVRLGPSDRHPLRVDERDLQQFVYGDPQGAA